MFVHTTNIYSGCGLSNPPIPLPNTMLTRLVYKHTLLLNSIGKSIPAILFLCCCLLSLLLLVLMLILMPTVRAASVRPDGCSFSSCAEYRMFDSISYRIEYFLLRFLCIFILNLICKTSVSPISFNLSKANHDVLYVVLFPFFHELEVISI